MKVVIIGNHAAGLTAAETLRELNKSCEITVISKEEVPPYSRCLIPYIVSGKKNIDNILFKPKDFYKKNSIDTLFGIEVVKVLTDKKEILLNDKKKLTYDSLIIASGGDPSIPDLPGIKNNGVFGFRTLEDANKIKNYSENINIAVVLGGGLVGIKAAVALFELGKKVKILVNSSNILSQLIGKEEAEVVQEYITELGIEIKYNMTPAKILGKGKVEGIEIKNKEIIDCQLIVIGKGIRANKSFIESTDIKTDFGIIIDEHCKTNIPDVYAAGDVAQSKDSIRKENWMNALWPLAVEEGRIAAENILGKQSILRERTSMNSLSFHNLSLISCGLTGSREKNDNSEKIIIKGKNKRDFKKFIFKDNHLVGFVLIGNVSNAGVLTTLIRKEINIKEVKDQILGGHYDFASMLPLIKENSNKFYEPEFKELFNFLKS